MRINIKFMRCNERVEKKPENFSRWLENVVADVINIDTSGAWKN